MTEPSRDASPIHWGPGFRRSPEEALAHLKALAPLALPEGLWEAIASAHLSPVRAYHHLGHVADVASRWAEIQAARLWESPKEAFVATLFHDAIYQAGRKDNEARSAAWAVESVTRCLPAAGLDLALLRRLIELTARHGKLAPGEVSGDEAHFLDADMAILAAPASIFQAYDQAIRQEHRLVPGFLYRRGRKAFLQGLLGPAPIFHSPWGQGHWEAAARAQVLAALVV